VPYSPLGRGFLTGRFRSLDDLPEDDYRRFSPRFQGENFEHNLELVEVVELLAAEHGVAPSQLALAWVLSRGEHVVPIPGTKHVSFVEENIAALELELSDSDLGRLTEAMPEPAGERYDEAGMATVNR
jgi:aryl-alcohol dehydrogenase-like predicted oxidoreductase